MNAKTTIAPKGRATAKQDESDVPLYIAAERAAVMKALHPIVEMLGTMVGPHVEVVLHDLMRPEHSIIAIANGHISHRSIGSPIISGPKNDKAFYEAKKQLTDKGTGEHSVIDDYPTVTSDGLRLKSSTVVLRDSRGEPFAALCLNADMTMFRTTFEWLEAFLKVKPQVADAEATRPALDTLMQEIIDEAVHRHGKPLALMKKEEKMLAVSAMLQRGLFIVKGGVERAADALGVSRFTIYNYMEELRRRGDAGASSLPKGMKREATLPRRS